MIELSFYKKENNSINDILKCLRKDEAINNMIISIITKSIKQFEDSTEENFVLYTFDGERIINVVVLSNGKLMLSGESHTQSMQLLINQINGRKNKVKNVLGTFDLVALYFSILKKSKFFSSTIKLETILMKLTRVNKVSYSEGKFRKAIEEDVNKVAVMLGDFLQEALNISDAEIKTKAENMINDGSVFVLEVNKEIVCISAIARNLEKHAAISYVYTPLAHRGKGYATKCVGKLSQLILEDMKKHCILYADKHNKKSQKVYRKLGYKNISEFNEVSLEMKNK